VGGRILDFSFLVIIATVLATCPWLMMRAFCGGEKEGELSRVQVSTVTNFFFFHVERGYQHQSSPRN
jgi:hypothetical protein